MQARQGCGGVQAFTGQQRVRLLLVGACSSQLTLNRPRPIKRQGERVPRRPDAALGGARLPGQAADVCLRHRKRHLHQPPACLHVWQCVHVSSGRGSYMGWEQAEGRSGALGWEGAGPSAILVAKLSSCAAFVSDPLLPLLLLAATSWARSTSGCSTRSMQCIGCGLAARWSPSSKPSGMR